MKKILVCLLLGVCCLGLVGCGNDNSKKDDSFIQLGDESNINIADNGVSLKIKEGSLIESSAIYILENNSNMTAYFGKGSGLQKEQDGKWYNLKLKEEEIIELPLFGIEPKHSSEESTTFANYGKLNAGKYRIVKNMSFQHENDVWEDFYVAGEFIID